MKKFYSASVLGLVALLFTVCNANATAYSFNVTSSRTLTIARAGTNCNTTANSCTFNISNGTASSYVYLYLNEDCTNCTFASANGYSVVQLAANVALSSSLLGSANLNGGYLVIPNGLTLTLNTNLNLNNGSSPFNNGMSSHLIVGNANGSTATAELNLNGKSVYLNSSSAIVYLGTTHSLIDDKSTPIKFGNITYTGSGGGHVLFSAFGLNPSTAAPYTKISNLNYSLSGLGQSVIQTSAPAQFLFTTSGVTPLPIILVDFNASLNGNNTVSVTWATTQEENSSYFSIERSADGASWTSIGTVAAQGNSSTTTDYSFTDNSPLGEINYYRLQSFDLDGKYTYSEVRVVRSTATESLSIFPNPAKTYVNIFLGKTATTDLTVRLINASGQVVQSKILGAGGTNISLLVSNYPAGVYLLHISGANGSVQTSKVLISR
ncbi:MAG: T9SS type A sorting domain-containing protein [Bacteroidetes bacterium]|nr:T9SS type A sorting domain-containing protein [Bacteroidota bacterium]